MDISLIDCWYWLSSIFVRLIAFWLGKFILISASSFFLQVFNFASFLIFVFHLNIGDSLFWFADCSVLWVTKISCFIFCTLFWKMLIFFLIVAIISLYCLSLNKSTILLHKLFLWFCNLNMLQLSALIIPFCIFNDANFNMLLHCSFVTTKS